MGNTIEIGTSEGKHSRKPHIITSILQIVAMSLWNKYFPNVSHTIMGITQPKGSEKTRAQYKETVNER